MDARINIEARRESAAALLAPPRRSAGAALHWSIVADESAVSFDLSAEIFKKTRYVADSKLGSPYVAKDIIEIAKIPLLKTLLEHGHHGDCDATIGTPNVKLTDAKRAERKTKGKARATNHSSGSLARFARRDGLAFNGAVTHRDGGHEKQYYAGI